MSAGDPLDEEVLARLREDFASTDDLGELATLIRNFLRRGAGLVAEVGAALERGDLEGVRATAHRLKGSSSTIGAGLLAAAAGSVESAARGADAPAVADAVREVEVAFDRTQGALEERAEAIARSA